MNSVKLRNENLVEGFFRTLKVLEGEIEDMMCPVLCSHCNTVYDLTNVEVIHRYADCTLFKSPCCDTKVDDRSWKSMPDFKELDSEHIYTVANEIAMSL